MNAGHFYGSKDHTEALIADEWALLLWQPGNPQIQQAARCASCGDK